MGSTDRAQSGLNKKEHSTIPGNTSFTTAAGCHNIEADDSDHFPPE